MASWLVIDWDQDHFHVVCAQTSRGGVRVTRAVSWPHPEPFTPSTAERVGKALREFLKTERIMIAPVLFGLGRDRVFLKELRFPAIAPHEEAALVRFQTGKELTESVDNYAVDHVHLQTDTADREVMTVAVRRDVVTMIQTLCQGAGLRLHAITPKLFGMANVVDRAMLPAESPLTPKSLNAVLAVGQRWAELCFFKGRRLLQAQSVANGPMLSAEIKRNLAVFRAQHAVNLELTGPECLYQFGAETAENSQQVPICLLNPLRLEPELAAKLKNAGCFAGAVGLAELWSSPGEKPINLLAPRRQSAPLSAIKRRGLLLGATAAILFVILIAGMWFVLHQKRAQIHELEEERMAQESFLNANVQERAEAESYREWEQNSVSILDEMYDLSARHPWHEGFRVNHFNAKPLAVKKNGKERFVGSITLNGFAPPNKELFVKNLNDSMSRDAHVRPQIKSVKTNGPAPIDFQIEIEIARQDYKKYDGRLVVPAPVYVIAVPPQPKKVEPEPEPDPNDDGGAEK